MASVQHHRASKRRAPTQQTELTLSTATSALLRNTRGLPGLADEIYLEILSYFPAFPIPFDHQNPGPEADVYNYRCLALDALSQTCRNLRRVFLPYRWERIEVYDEMDLGRGPLRKGCYSKGSLVSDGQIYANELFRQLEVVTVRNPSLAEYVEVLDIVVVHYAAEEVLPELARCIALMPNLRTVQLEFEGDSLRLMNEIFEPYMYPQIQTACVTTYGYSFLYFCPKLKRIIGLRPNSWRRDRHRHFFESVASNCHFSIEILGPIHITLGSLLSQHALLDYYIKILAELKNIREVTFQSRQLPADSVFSLSNYSLISLKYAIQIMKAFWKVASLQTIRLAIGTEFHDADEIKEWKLRMIQRLSTGAELTEGERKELIVTIVYTN